MADLVDTSAWQKRYEVIENAYCQGKWAAVIENGTVLLRGLLDADGDPEVGALRHRMQLLMAHTLLHGYGDRDAAEDLYEVVRSSDAEPTLRQMAEDGLDLCHQPLPSSLALEEDGEDDAPRSEPSRAQMPLQPLPAVSPQTLPESESAPDAPVEAKNGLGMATDPFGAKGGVPLPLPVQDLPVMPWLTEPPASLNEALTSNVVEEPELIELHQASSSLAGEVDLLIKEDFAPNPPGPVNLEPEGDGDLRTGLLLVVVG
ncbi:MAG: hypothetical protein VKL58_02945 [Cyanobacteriota bacterium]|nr:hypothetical protein [Cyanobacteriota bacterium]